MCRLERLRATSGRQPLQPPRTVRVGVGVRYWNLHLVACGYKFRGASAFVAPSPSFQPPQTYSAHSTSWAAHRHAAAAASYILKKSFMLSTLLAAEGLFPAQLSKIASAASTSQPVFSSEVRERPRSNPIDTNWAMRFACSSAVVLAGTVPLPAPVGVEPEARWMKLTIS
eukprot:scaffold322715_cov32-Tisochrysis_lutea.AAC.1